MPDSYVYDGTYYGFLTVAVHCFRIHRAPVRITPEYMLHEDAGESSDYVYVRTSVKDAGHLCDVLTRVATPEAEQTASDFFLTRNARKELILFRYIYDALREGAKIAEEYTREPEKTVAEAVRDLYREAHMTLGGVEFTECNDVSCAVISPQNNVMPLIAKPILARKELDDVLVYDRRHRILLKRRGEISSIDELWRERIPEINTAEELYGAVWQEV